MPSKITKYGVLLLAFSPILLQAAETDDDTVSVLETVIVSGELQARDIQDTTSSVSVFNAERLEQGTATTIDDVLNRSANVTKAFGDTGFAIRGVTQTSGGGVGRTINVSVDGASLPSTQSTFFGPYSTWDLEQVEYLRGPQSTQQGRNSIAGSVNVRSADPEFERETKLRLNGGSFNEKGIAFTHNQPISDRVAVRIAVENTENDGAITNPTRNDDAYDARESSLVRAKILYLPTDNTSVVLGHNFSESRGGADQIDEDAFPDGRINYSDHEADEGSKHNITSLKVEHDINDQWSVGSETTYYKHEYERIEDSDRTAAALGFIDREVNDDSVSQELKFTYDGDDKLRAAVGFFATRIETDFDSELTVDASLVSDAAPLGLATFNSLTDRQTITTNVAAFGELEYDFSTKLSVVAGARYDYENVNIEDDVIYSIDPDSLSGLLPENEVLDTDTSFNAFLPKIGLKYQLTENVNTSFTIQRGYRAGGANRNQFTLEVSEFSPEYTTNYELALRSRLLNDRLTLNGNIYYTDWEDQQVRVAGDSGNNADLNTVNAGKSKLYGAEIDFALGVNKKLDIYTSLGYAIAEFDEFVSGGVDLSGNTFANAPKFTASIGGKYQFNNRWSLSVDGNYKDSFYSNPDNSEDSEVDSRFVVDAKLGYDAQAWSANVYARNLLDKDYLTQALDSSSRAGDPRQVGLEVNFKF